MDIMIQCRVQALVGSATSHRIKCIQSGTQRVTSGVNKSVPYARIDLLSPCHRHGLPLKQKKTIDTEVESIVTLQPQRLSRSAENSASLNSASERMHTCAGRTHSGFVASKTADMQIVWHLLIWVSS